MSDDSNSVSYSPEYPRGKPQAHTCYGDDLPEKQKEEHNKYRKGMCKAADYTGTKQRSYFAAPKLKGALEDVDDFSEKVGELEISLKLAEDAKKEALDNMNTVVTSLRNVSAELIVERARNLRITSENVFDASGMEYKEAILKYREWFFSRFHITVEEAQEKIK